MQRGARFFLQSLFIVNLLFTLVVTLGDQFLS